MTKTPFARINYKPFSLIQLAVAILVGLPLAHRLGLGAPLLESWPAGRGDPSFWQINLSLAVTSGAVLSALLVFVNL